MLNINNLDLANKMMEEERVWSLNNICEAVAGIAFTLVAPKLPRKIEVVMKKFIDKMISRDDNIEVINGGCYIISATGEDLTDIIYSELTSIKEFREWNLTSLEYEHGVDPDDDRDNEWWRKSEKDFVDLEAFKQNVYCALRSKLIEDYFFDNIIYNG